MQTIKDIIEAMKILYRPEQGMKYTLVQIGAVGIIKVRGHGIVFSNQIKKLIDSGYTVVFSGDHISVTKRSRQ